MPGTGTPPGPGVGAPPVGPPSWVVDALRAAGCVFAEDEAVVLVEAAADRGELAAMVRRRVDGLPLEHIVGWAEFCGLRIGVDAGVFVPRRRSELLVRQALTHVANRPDGVVVDLCCGGGAIGVAISAAAADVRVHAVDVDPVAVRCAEANLAPFGGTAYRGDLFEPLPPALRGQVRVLVANAPYVPTNAIALMPPEARDHEPAAALDGGPDGTGVLRRVIAGAPDWLAADGVVLVEVGESQIRPIIDALITAGLTPGIVADDELGGTVAQGRSPGWR